MPRPKTITLTMAASDDDAVCQSQTPSGAGALTINGALASGGVATLDVPRHILITAAANESGRTFTLTGTDRFGKALSTTTAGPNATTKIVTAYNFKTLTTVSIDGAATGAVKVGTADSLESQWLPMDWRGPEAPKVSVALSSAANLTFTGQLTASDIQASGFVETSATTSDVSALTGTASALASLSGPARAFRLKLSSFVAGTVTLTLMERGNHG